MAAALRKNMFLSLCSRESIMPYGRLSADEYLYKSL